MHPAYSVIFFTTASGAGYGLLAMMGVLNFGDGFLPADRWFGLAAFIISFGLITFGLLASTFHLGHPERSWRALTQWRSSWLSREGVLAILTYIPAGLFAYGWVILEQTSGIWMIFGMLAAIGAGFTVHCTSMIYASLKAIPTWNNEIVSPMYLILGQITGGLILVALLYLYDTPIFGMSAISIIILAVALAVKLKYWKVIENSPQETDLTSATGLGSLGKVRVLDTPHTSKNYLQQEMGYRIARKHAEKLRRLTVVTLFAAPIILLGVASFFPVLAIGTSLLAVLAAALGIVLERWLFFAEAKHVVMIYYDG